MLFIDPKKIVGVVETNVDDETGHFRPCDETTLHIGANVAAFLAGELKSGRIPASFLPIQSGVGETANAVLKALGENPDIPGFEMYTEVIQDAVIDLMRQGRIRFASGSSLTLSPEMRSAFYDEIDFFRSKILLRPQEITNHPEVVRRLGIISCNTALEVDIFGNVNSTHLLGRKMMNGIGGSGDFTRNSFISMFICASTQKSDKISTIVPLVTHVDHNEHSVQVVVTEWGVADLALQGADRARGAYYRPLRPPRFPRHVARLSDAVPLHAHAPRLVGRVRHARAIRSLRRYARQNGLTAIAAGSTAPRSCELDFTPLVTILNRIKGARRLNRPLA